MTGETRNLCIAPLRVVLWEKDKARESNESPFWLIQACQSLQGLGGFAPDHRFWIAKVSGRLELVGDLRSGASADCCAEEVEYGVGLGPSTKGEEEHTASSLIETILRLTPNSRIRNTCPIVS